MYSGEQYQRLYDIPSLPDKLLEQKYLPPLDVYNDPNTVSNFMQEVIRDTRPDAPVFESDMARQGGSNSLGQSLLNMQEHGSRYSHVPFHPELFLGDLTKDPRMSGTDPRTTQMTDQARFRQERYVHGKLQDVRETYTEGTVGEKRMLRQIKQGYNDTATRMGGIFGDSTDGINPKANANPGRTIKQVGDTIHEDQKIYETAGEKILPQYGTDIVSKLSNLIGAQWESQPDSKFGLSSVSNVYRSKQEVDQSANAVFRLGKQDTQFKSEKNGFKNGTHVFHTDSLKAARANAQNVSIVMKKDSMKNRFIAAMLPPPIPTKHVSRFIGTQAKKHQIMSKGTRYKFTPGNQTQESLVEPIKSISDANIVVNHAIVPPRDVRAILYKVSRDNKQNRPEETRMVPNKFSARTLANAFTTRNDGVQSQLTKKEGLHVPTIYGVPSKGNEVDRVSLTASKFAEAKEETNINPTGSNTLPAVKSLDDFDFDTDPTMNNNYQTRRGTVQRNGTRVIAQRDSDNAISPVSDIVAPFRTNYAK